MVEKPNPDDAQKVEIEGVNDVDARSECRELREALVPFLDGELSSSEAERLDLHLTRCASCGEALALHRQVKKYLDDSPGPAAPTAEFDLASGVRQRVRYARVRSRILVGSVAACALLAIGVWIAVRGSLGGVEDPTAKGEPVVDVDDEIIDHLEVLEFLQDEGADLELVQALLGELDWSDEESDSSLDDFLNDISQL